MRQSLSALILLAVLLTGCSNSYQISSAAEHKEQVTLNVVTSYGQDDGSHDLYEAAVSNFQKETGVDIRDHSDVSSEKWKNKVLTDFITGSEPDVLFYFVDADAEPIVQAEKVVSIEEIRELYPDYASNMKGSMMPVAYDGRHYAVPSTGFWETMFVNKTVLDQCGIEIPGPDYTWSQFLEDCQTIKECGFIPIACSLFETPHYLFEFTVMNNGTVHDHYQCPRLTEDGQLKDEPVSRKWIQALNDIKLFYDEGFFPENTLTASDTETVSLFAEGKAAFLVDGSWKVGYFTENYPDHLNNYLVSYFPGKGGRAATDAIGGISMGYYITRKAWNDLDKRQAAVDFVSSS